MQRLGASVTISKNRLRANAVNFVFGAHLGFPAELRDTYPCIFVNLEQLGPGGAKVSDDYLNLLKTSGVADYSPSNTLTYATSIQDVPIISFAYAPYLSPLAVQRQRLDQRPIDLLFFGSLNERRKQYIERIESCGVQVCLFDHPLYSEERDQYIRQAKAVINCQYYETGTFEQVRAFHCLSLGTPIISEYIPNGALDNIFGKSITWLQPHEIEPFFTNVFGTQTYFKEAEHQLDIWKHTDATEQYAELLAFASGYIQGHKEKRPNTPWRPTMINLGSGKDYKSGWLNLDILDRTEPDLVLNLGVPQTFPIHTTTRYGQDVILSSKSIRYVLANNVLEHVPDLPQLMTNVLDLLEDGGQFEIEVPYEKAVTAWQDPTHIRAMNENSWTYFTDWFWYLGWFEHRFEVAQSMWLDAQLQPCGKESAAFMRVILKKVQTSPRERTIARTMQADFSELEHEAIESESA
jgi:hypothetical protein